MNFMDKVKTMRAEHPPRILIYGPPGMGKTSLAAEFPNPVFALVEDGVPSGLEVAGVKPATFDETMSFLSDLAQEEHPFQTLVIDSIDKLQPLLWDAVCSEKNWASIETPGYGKGYVETEYKWRQLIEALNWLRVERRMTIVLISHADVERFDDPTSSSYSTYQVRLHKSGRKLIEDEMDAIFLIKQEPAIKNEDQGFNKKRAVAEGGATRWIYCEGRPAFTAKNRGSGMPPKIQYIAGKGFEALAPYFPTIAA